jgi:hypothetical protein
MVVKVWNLLFGCRHRNITRPITPVHKYDAPPSDTYVVCLECGKRFHYDTTKMRMGTQMPLPLISPYGGGGPFQSNGNIVQAAECDVCSVRVFLA